MQHWLHCTATHLQPIILSGEMLPPFTPPHAPQAFMRRVVQVPPLREKYSMIQKERAEAGGADAMDLS